MDSTMQDVCYIVGAGQCDGIYINENNRGYVIAADGGMKYLLESDIIPDLIIGDFDSLEYIPKHKNVVKLPVEKDITDMLAAVNAGLEKGFKKFIIYGGLGGRADHSYANYQVLNYLAKNGCIGVMVDREFAVTSLHKGNVKFNRRFKGTLSVFAQGKSAKGVTIKGFKYELTDGKLKNDFPLGVSNEFTGKTGLVEVKEGSLLVMFNCKPEIICDGIGRDIKFGGIEK